MVVSSRVRLARNLNEQHFPGRADKAQSEAVLQACLSSLECLKDAWVFHVADLSNLERKILVERHFISPDLLNCPLAAVVIAKDYSLSVMVNEEDHLRIQALKNGYQLSQAWKSVNILDDSLEKSLPLAFDTALGYLTTCPTNLGTGLRASVMLHLPALIISQRLKDLLKHLKQKGIIARGFFGEGSKLSGSLLQISNQRTLGKSEKDILLELSRAIELLLEQENKQRETLLKQERPKLLNQIARAYGVLKYAYLIESSEAMDALGFLRLAVDLGAFENTTVEWMDDLFVAIQPGHIELEALRLGKIPPHASLDSTQRDSLRAEFLKHEIHHNVPPSLDKI